MFLPLLITLILAWDPGAGPLPEGYSLERRIGTAPYTELLQTSDTTTTDTPPDTLPICYQVRAYNALTTSAPSNEICLTTLAAPINFTLSTTGPTPTTASARINIGTRRKPR